MNKEEIKYCKFCDEEKPIKEFCKSGSFIKNICRECQNKKQKEIYHNSKKVKDLQQRIDKIMEIIELNQYSYGYQIKEEILGDEEYE